VAATSNATTATIIGLATSTPGEDVTVYQVTARRLCQGDHGQCERLTDRVDDSAFGEGDHGTEIETLC
jgi:hypothetical protein